MKTVKAIFLTVLALGSILGAVYYALWRGWL